MRISTTPAKAIEQAKKKAVFNYFRAVPVKAPISITDLCTPSDAWVIIPGDSKTCKCGNRLPVIEAVFCPNKIDLVSKYVDQCFEGKAGYCGVCGID